MNRTILPLIGLVALSGCALQDPPKPPEKPIDGYVGTWVPENREIPGAPLQAQMFLSMLTLELHKNGTFNLQGIEGTWDLRGDKIILKPESVMGMGFEEAVGMAGASRRRRPPRAAASAMSQPREFEIVEPKMKIRSIQPGAPVLTFTKKQ